ncbi:unnamed protein product [Dovyalis caffra]|uniref:F-box domain-containing protein n=1 Tax=Dovyalis caffra TaxID=77055 RepID=A0AAV1SQZ3_9ROSI|nr:unnamed protein product [Dovyalis caffra]
MSSRSILPHNILEEIFLKLPITTLIQCRYVCKSWKNILANPNFAKLHQQLTDVLLCVQEVVDFPRGEYLNLPPLDEEKGLHSHLCGLGFSPKSNRFKAIRITYKKEKHMPGNSQALAEVCTLGTESWRSVGFAPLYDYTSLHFSLLEHKNVFVNESLHWLPKKLYGSSGYLEICAFDFDREQFRTFSAPPHRYLEYLTLDISTFGESQLCMYFQTSDDLAIDVWLMKEYGVAESWTKILVIQDSYEFKLNNFLELKLNNFLKNGNILLMGCDIMLLYNHGKKIFTEVDTHGVTIQNGAIQHKDRYGFGTCFVHKPSFVSLKDMIEVDNSKFRVRVLQYDAKNNVVYCSCKMFDSQGILSCHALRILNVKCITSILVQYVVKRWVEEGKKGIMEYEETSLAPMSSNEMELAWRNA